MVLREQLERVHYFKDRDANKKGNKEPLKTHSTICFLSDSLLLASLCLNLSFEPERNNLHIFGFHYFNIILVFLGFFIIIN